MSSGHELRLSKLSFWIPLPRGEARPCPYIPDEQLVLSAALSAGVPPQAFDLLLARGYRRSGLMLYRPACPGPCRSCIPIRVPIASFSPSRSQRRILARVDPRVTVRIGEPRFEAEHLLLHNRHARQVSADNKLCTAEEYVLAFVESCVTTHFLEYWIADRLVGLSTLDESPDALSSVYFCWEPELAALSLGTYSALWEMRWAAEIGKRYYYLGYWVEDCASMAYKNRFRPHELLDWDSGRWITPHPENFPG